MDGTEAVPVLRSQVPRALLGPAHKPTQHLDGTRRYRYKQMQLLLRPAGAYQKGTCTLSAAAPL